MNLLKGTRTYLIGAIEYTKDGKTWRNKAKDFLKSLNIVSFDPYDKPLENSTEEGNELFYSWREKLKEGKFDEVAEFARKIRSEDLRLTDIVDFAIAYIDPKVPTFGSVEELTQICRAKKPAFIVIEGGKENCPLWLLGMFSHKYIYNSFEDLFSVIYNIDAGIKEMDSHRWKLLKPEYR